MKRYCSSIAVLMVLAVTISCASSGKVEFIQKESQIDVMINGKVVTSYLYKPELTKPILYPVKTLSGIIVNRGYPFEKIKGESDDHPHHTGMFFTYDRINNDGFWNNATTPPQIKHVKVTEMSGGNEKGTLSTVMNWVGISGKTLLEEKRAELSSGDRHK